MQRGRLPPLQKKKKTGKKKQEERTREEGGRKQGKHKTAAGFSQVNDFLVVPCYHNEFI